MFKLGSLRSSFICNAAKQLECLKTYSGLEIAKPTRCCFAVKGKNRVSFQDQKQCRPCQELGQQTGKRGNCKSNYTSLPATCFPKQISNKDAWPKDATHWTPSWVESFVRSTWCLFHIRVFPKTHIAVMINQSQVMLSTISQVIAHTYSCQLC